jgi:hypothetical protein
MATLTLQAINRTGITPAFAACASGGDQFANAGNVFLYIKNGSGAPITVTIGTPQTVDGLAVADREVVVPATDEVTVGPFPRATYNDSSGYVQLTYSGVTTLTAAALSLTPVT